MKSDWLEKTQDFLREIGPSASPEEFVAIMASVSQIEADERVMRAEALSPTHKLRPKRLEEAREWSELADGLNALYATLTGHTVAEELDEDDAGPELEDFGSASGVEISAVEIEGDDNG